MYLRELARLFASSGCSRAIVCRRSRGATNDWLRECRSPSSVSSATLLPFFYCLSGNQSSATHCTAILLICHLNQVAACSLGTTPTFCRGCHRRNVSAYSAALAILAEKARPFRSLEDRCVIHSCPCARSDVPVFRVPAEPACSHGRGQTLFLSPCLQRAI
jgi:hypothetical protein